jgi:glycosyltransferase involved in cell wall biosynthesis
MVAEGSPLDAPLHRPELSVVVATVEAARNIGRCLTSIRDATEHLDAEIWVMDASRDDTGALATRHVPSDRVVHCAPGTTTLSLWAQGIARARGRVVALTTGHFRVEAGWARALLRAVGGDVGGAAGRIVLDERASAVDAAIFYLRYAVYLDPGYAPGHAPRMIPADNAGYDGQSLARHRASFRHGFSEVDFHRRLFGEGKHLMVVDGATATFGPSYPLRVITHHRFVHGREFAAWRATEQGGGTSRFRMVVGAPLVPFALALRAAMSALRHPAHRVRFLRSLPLLLFLASAWAIGEATGAAFGRDRNREPISET